MDYAVVFKEVADFFIQYCSVKVVFAGHSFSVGSLYLFGAIAVILIWFLKGMGR